MESRFGAGRPGSAHFPNRRRQGDAGGLESLAGRARGLGAEDEAGVLLFDLDLFDLVEIVEDRSPLEALAALSEAALVSGGWKAREVGG